MNQKNKSQLPHLIQPKISTKSYLLYVNKQELDVATRLKLKSLSTNYSEPD